jgi:hypothetical protein
MADGAAHLGMGGRTEDLGRMHPRVDGLNGKEDDGDEADEYAKQNTRPRREHHPQELPAMSPASAHRPGLSIIVRRWGSESDGEYSAKSY